MRETPPATAPTAEVTDDDRRQARTLVLHARNVTKDVARALVEARAAAYAAGREEAADEAHAAGHREAVDVLRSELVAGQGTHDCPACNPNPRDRSRLVGELADGRTCPLCDGYGAL